MEKKRFKPVEKLELTEEYKRIVLLATIFRWSIIGLAAVGFVRMVRLGFGYDEK